MVLVDTSIWIEYLDRGNQVVEEDLDSLLRTDKAATYGLVLAELRHGCQTSAQVRNLIAAMEPVIYLEVAQASWLRAGEIAAESATRGYRLDLGDCLLASWPSANVVPSSLLTLILSASRDSSSFEPGATKKEIFG